MALKEQVSNIYSVGLQNAGSYQVSGTPYITGAVGQLTGSEKKFEFPYVTKSIVVINHSTGAVGRQEIRVHFNATGSGNVYGGHHFVELDSDEDTIELRLKCKEIYVSVPSSSLVYEDVSHRQYKLIAELTNIPVGRMWELTGSGLTD